MVAARLDDMVKGLDFAIEALNSIAERYPEVAKNYEMLFVGEIRDTSVLDKLKFPYKTFGVVRDGKKLKSLYLQSAVVLSSSLYESLPGTLIEGQASGAIPVSFGIGGQADIIDDGKTGFIAKYKDSTDLADCIIKAINSNIDPKALHNSVVLKYSEETIAKAYISLIKNILS